MLFLSFLLKGENIVPVISFKGRQCCSCPFVKGKAILFLSNFSKGDNVVPGIFLKWRQVVPGIFRRETMS